jgi:hypothetical protein
MERPDTGGLLSEIRDFVARYVILPGDHFYDAVALWTLHSHAIGAADTSPRLVFKSPEKESGKTRALEALEVITPNPLLVMNTTIAAIFRLLAEEEVTTLLHDEVDAIFSAKAGPQNEDLRALLNAGYRRGATVARVVGEGKKMTVKRFPVFAATALAAIGDLPDTIESRSIIVPMRRRAPDEPVAQFRRRRVELESQGLREALTEWASIYIDVLSVAEPEMPDGVTDRAADCWEPLLAIGELAGGEWLQRARAAAAEIVGGRVAEDSSVGVRLLADIQVVFADRDRMSTSGLLGALNALDESGWGGWNDGKGMNPRDLGRRLRPYGVKSKNVRLDGTQEKGYGRADFADPFARYLRYVSVPTVPTVPGIRIRGTDAPAGTDTWGVTDTPNGHPSEGDGDGGDDIDLTPLSSVRAERLPSMTGWKLIAAAGDELPGCCRGLWVSREMAGAHAAEHGAQLAEESA